MTGTDLTSFAALLGDSFASKVDLLSQIIKNRHYPSIGAYKENLLAKTIREFIPKRFSVSNGFVLFPHDVDNNRSQDPGFDELNMSSYSLSHQVDIIIHDNFNYPVVFADDDFVIARPESVKAIIEVKGTVSKRELMKTLENFLDFGRKWRRTQIFYRNHHQSLSKKPSLEIMCWDVARDNSGRALTNGVKIRKQIADYYRLNVKKDELVGMPFLDRLYLYNDCQVSYSGWSECGELPMGWSTSRGKFMRVNKLGKFEEKGDRTVAALLASMHYSVQEDFNRFFSYQDEIADWDLNFEQKGFSSWLTELCDVRAANSDYIDGRLFGVND